MSFTEEFKKLVDIMARLRGPEGCPWDKEQTPETLRAYCIEEAYEVVEAVDSKDPKFLAEELGDLLLQIVFHAQIASEEGDFTIEDPIRSINEKLIRRHPHVFRREEGDREITSLEVKENWAKIKKKEGKKRHLDGVPKSLPSLLRSAQIGEKASMAGFDWKTSEEVWKKVLEELDELQSAQKDPEAVEEEFGDLLFALANWARHKKFDPELALRQATMKFQRRFKEMEDEAETKGLVLEDLGAEKLEELWEQAKEKEDRP